MATTPKKSLGLDTNLLLDMAGDKDFAHEFKDEFLARGYDLLVPPTVVAEFVFFEEHANLPPHRLATLARERLTPWKCRPFSLSATELTIAVRFANRLIDSLLIPETEQNDGKILAQLSLAGVPMVATSDKHLLDIEEEALVLAFGDADLFPVHPAHPRRLLRAIR